MNSSFHTKSAAVSLLAILAIGIYYFANVVTQLDAPLQTNAALPAGMWQLAITTIVLLIILEVTLHIVLTLGDRQAAASASRDRNVEDKAMRNAYVVLAAGVLVSFGMVFFNVSVFVMSHILLLFFVLAELTKYASQLLYYRHTV